MTYITPQGLTSNIRCPPVCNECVGLVGFQLLNRITCLSFVHVFIKTFSHIRYRSQCFICVMDILSYARGTALCWKCYIILCINVSGSLFSSVLNLWLFQWTAICNRMC